MGSPLYICRTFPIFVHLKAFIKLQKNPSHQREGKSTVGPWRQWDLRRSLQTTSTIQGKGADETFPYSCMIQGAPSTKLHGWNTLLMKLLAKLPVFIVVFCLYSLQLQLSFDKQRLFWSSMEGKEACSLSTGVSGWQRLPQSGIFLQVLLIAAVDRNCMKSRKKWLMPEFPWQFAYKFVSGGGLINEVNTGFMSAPPK